MYNKKFKLIVVIIKKGFSKNMIKTAKAIGLEGATILNANGTANAKLFESRLGLSYDPEREVILAATSVEILDDVINCFIDKGELEKKNTGILFVVDLNQCAGIAHLLGIEGIK